ncbi:Protein of unknown function (DUF982) [Rhizobium leguminosarum bv. trifolii WSM2297]|uniref:DUF982 domain-containing protein n=1 Tax=Rhizobium leguminosarum bv. trifolii WSM2297 TaxID=754762 RepID=J0D004_RHILT|nr:DUF982 domain-containing protein [Rhizobium leguminosarum]EJC85640.1 Protein of unknown function (DUF982) [Rhizobium leguminosarum bv. trifolii WSM2297]
MCWNTSSAFTPVGLSLGSPASHRIVRTLGDAAYLLINDWPFDDGEEYVAAVKACVDAISGKITPQQFQQALLRAANEAGIAALTVVQQGAGERWPDLPSSAQG